MKKEIKKILKIYMELIKLIDSSIKPILVYLYILHPPL